MLHHREVGGLAQGRSVSTGSSDPLLGNLSMTVSILLMEMVVYILKVVNLLDFGSVLRSFTQGQILEESFYGEGRGGDWDGGHVTFFQSAPEFDLTFSCTPSNLSLFTA